MSIDFFHFNCDSLKKIVIYDTGKYSRSSFHKHCLLLMMVNQSHVPLGLNLEVSQGESELPGAHFVLCWSIRLAQSKQ